MAICISVAQNDTLATLVSGSIDIAQVLRDNDAYHALTRTGGLIKTGGTETNVNDVAIVLIRR